MRYLNKLINTIKKSKKTVIATHFDPDADGICAALSSAYLVHHYTRRTPVLFCHSNIPSKYTFLLNKYRFTKVLPGFDLMIAVDSAGISRIFPEAQNITDERLQGIPIINIDHHKSNTSFGEVRIVQASVSSACEIIYNIFKRLSVPMNKQLANIFYCGIYSETGGFVYPNTTKESLTIASELVACGVQPGPIAKKLNAKTFTGTLLLSEVLKTIKVHRSVGVMMLTRRMLRKSRARMDDSEHFVSFLQAIDTVRVSVFLREEKDGIRVSLRSDGIVDVDKLAARFGGGGHRLAAGVRLPQGIESARDAILSAIFREIRKRT
ncbi:bifunctional oligoribonuclease/PAP phosphatase NrnA [candidate division WOR-3 bacterium]|nr:bifunctional oligoribonuclease/PAP phosphatase NrnA [candidate division WOR-3 bacterium]